MAGHIGWNVDGKSSHSNCNINNCQSKMPHITQLAGSEGVGYLLSCGAEVLRF